MIKIKCGVIVKAEKVYAFHNFYTVDDLIEIK